MFVLQVVMFIPGSASLPDNRGVFRFSKIVLHTPNFDKSFQKQEVDILLQSLDYIVLNARPAHSYFKWTLVRLCGIAEKWDNPSFTAIYWHFVKSKHVYFFNLAKHLSSPSINTDVFVYFQNRYFVSCNIGAACLNAI